MFEHAAKLGWEGIIAKRADAPYRSERNEKLAEDQDCAEGQVSCCWVYQGPHAVSPRCTSASMKARPRLHGQGRHRLVPHRLKPIRKQLDTVVSPKSKLTKPIKKPKAHG
jgi:bifunctional non-homologous end joining protein LigD